MIAAKNNTIEIITASRFVPLIYYEEQPGKMIFQHIPIQVSIYLLHAGIKKSDIYPRLQFPASIRAAVIRFVDNWLI